MMTDEEKEIKDQTIAHPKTQKPVSKEDNYCKKFGLLKKACVLYGYERFKESFIAIAEAATFVKAEKFRQAEIDKANAAKWKWKLNLPAKFELPMTKEQILQNEIVDEKFVKRLDLGDVDTTKVLTFI